MAAPTLLSADEFLHHPAAQEASELVRGEIVMMTPAGVGHGVIALRIVMRLSAFVESHDLGVVIPDNVGYTLPIPGERHDTVRAPDASFVSWSKLPGGVIPVGFLRCAPDLAVEVRSPDDRPGELAARMRDYVAAGTRCMWVVDPAARTVTVHVPGEPPLVVDDTGSVEGRPVLEGFTLPVAPLFVGLAAR